MNYCIIGSFYSQEDRVDGLRLKVPYALFDSENSSPKNKKASFAKLFFDCRLRIHATSLLAWHDRVSHYAHSVWGINNYNTFCFYKVNKE
jgi:hypothetical protein